MRIQKTTLWVVVVLLGLGSGVLYAGNPAAAPAGKYGEGVRLEETTPIHQILADPDAYIGKTVRVEGKIADVCPRRGCWMELAGAEGKIRIKVEDDVIVFPEDAKGQVAAAEGKVVAQEMSRESYVAWLAHLAEEKGETFDEAAAKIGDGPYRLIQIQGTGARIEAEDQGSDG